MRTLFVRYETSPAIEQQNTTLRTTLVETHVFTSFLGKAAATSVKLTVTETAKAIELRQDDVPDSCERSHSFRSDLQ